jgi:hypothetical protein
MYKKLFQLGAIAAFIISLSGCMSSKFVHLDTDPNKQIHYSKIASVNDISQYVIYLNQGDKVPVYVKLEHDLVALAEEKIDLVLKRKVYVKLSLPDNYSMKQIEALTPEQKKVLISQIKIYISPDSSRWANVYDMKQVKALFGIDREGMLSFGAGIDKEKGLHLYFYAAG